MSREAMKLALEYLEESDNYLGSLDHSKPIAALREALAEQPAQQEPVAWGVDWGKAGDIPCVSIIKRLHSGGIEVVAVEYAPYSYTSPPAQRKPLTFSKLCDIEYEITHRDGDFSILKFARAIEAAHGIKENT